MNKHILYQYINKLKKEDIVKFGIKEGIIIKMEETNLIYDYIKNKYDEIINHPKEILIEIKNKVSDKLYQKLLELYNKYKDMLDKLK